MPIRVKTTADQSRYSSGQTREECPLNNGGQAVIEYVLMLVVSVSLILALSLQVFKPFEKYMQVFMGEYVQCLLETGALPSFGGDGVLTAQDMGCTMASFDKVNGKNGAGGRGGSAGGGRSASTGDSASESSSSTSSQDSGGAQSSGGSGSTYAGSASRRGGGFGQSRRVQSGVEGSGENGKVTEIAVEGMSGGGFFKSSTVGAYSSRFSRKVSSVGLSGLTESDRKKIDKLKPTQKRMSVAVSEEFRTQTKKINVKKPEVKTEVREEGENFTIGNFIRYLFIAALIIALVVFIGGQALSMSKSE